MSLVVVVRRHSGSTLVVCHCVIAFFLVFSRFVCVDLSPCALCGILPVLRLILVVLISLYLSHNHFASLHQLLSCLFEGHLID